MNTLLIKKVDEPWKFDVTLNGIDIPHVSNVEIIEKEGDLPLAVIAVVIINSSNNNVIVER